LQIEGNNMPIEQESNSQNKLKGQLSSAQSRDDFMIDMFCLEKNR